MSESITLELPEAVLEQARSFANRTNRPLETVLSDWLNRFVTDFPVDSLSDDEVLMLCDLQMDENQQESLSDLLAAQREGTLSEAESAQLSELLTIYRRGMIRKAEALKIAVERGLPML